MPNYCNLFILLRVINYMLVETYAAMLNGRLLIPVARTRYVAVDKTYWTESFSLRIASVEVDEPWYLDRYIDVAKAIADNLVASASQHYCQSGYFEHRMPYYIAVDADWYTEQYGDVKEAISNKIFESAQTHFEIIGYEEGRHPHPGFALRMKFKATL